MAVFFTGLCNSARSQVSMPWPPGHKDSVTFLFWGRKPDPLVAKAQCPQVTLTGLFIAWNDMQGCSPNSLQLLFSVQTIPLSNTEGKGNLLLYENQQNLQVWVCLYWVKIKQYIYPSSLKQQHSASLTTKLEWAPFLVILVHVAPPLGGTAKFRLLLYSPPIWLLLRIAL